MHSISGKELDRINRELNAPRPEGLKVGLKGALHQGQINALMPLFRDDVDTLMIACGRKFGKTEMAVYLLWRQALLHPGSACYYVAPSREQAKKLLWDVRRLHNYMSDKYVDGRPNNRDLMIRLKNGSFIQLMGSENYEAANGLSPHLIIYDEFKAFNPNYHRTMGPNRVTHGAKLVVIGTMADPHAVNKKEYDGLMKFCKQSESGYVHVATTFDNPINELPHKKKAIKAEIELLRARGDEDVVQREFYSRIVPGGSKAIFPMFSRKRFVRPHQEIVDEISQDISKIEWHNVLDPGNTTCFAGLFLGINPYTKKVYILDELYVTNQSDTSITRIMPEVLTKIYDITESKPDDIHDDWYLTCDEAAQWAITEILNQYNLAYTGTNKNLNKKDAGISLIKDIMLHDLVVISEKCENFIHELESYSKDDKGNIPKKDDHTIDCFRYALGANEYTMQEAIEAMKKPESDVDEWNRMRKMHDPILDDLDLGGLLYDDDFLTDF